MSSLSQENINKLCMTGVYRCEPVLSWLPSYKRDTPYHCVNWTFKVQKYKQSDKYYMLDTYWSGCEGLKVELTDENFDKFTLLFDLNKVSKICPPDFYDYDEEDRWHVALDSGGFQYSRYWFVRKGATKNQAHLLQRLTEERDHLRKQLEWKEEEIAKVMTDMMKGESGESLNK